MAGRSRMSGGRLCRWLPYAQTCFRDVRLEMPASKVCSWLSATLKVCSDCTHHHTAVVIVYNNNNCKQCKRTVINILLVHNIYNNHVAVTNRFASLG